MHSEIKYILKKSFRADSFVNKVLTSMRVCCNVELQLAYCCIESLDSEGL